MDLASKIKGLKEDCQKMDDERLAIEKRIHELQKLLDDKKHKSAVLDELKKKEEALLAQLL